METQKDYGEEKTELEKIAYQTPPQDKIMYIEVPELGDYVNSKNACKILAAYGVHCSETVFRTWIRKIQKELPSGVTIHFYRGQKKTKNSRKIFYQKKLIFDILAGKYEFLRYIDDGKYAEFKPMARKKLPKNPSVRTGAEINTERWKAECVPESNKENKLFYEGVAAALRWVTEKSESLMTKN